MRFNLTKGENYLLKAFVKSNAFFIYLCYTKTKNIMINPKELRLGNYLLASCEDDKNYFEQIVVNGLFEDEIRHDAIGMTQPTWETDPENVKPIPLTEEWLNNLGFTYQTMGIFTAPSVQYFSVIKWKDCDAEFTLIKDQKISVKYVHQLQNLYFALTGNELTIKQ